MQSHAIIQKYFLQYRKKEDIIGQYRELERAYCEIRFGWQDMPAQLWQKKAKPDTDIVPKIMKRADRKEM